MNDRHPLVAFGLLATTVALKARTGKLRNSDLLDLATSALSVWPDLPEGRAHVLAFLGDVQRDPARAGEALQQAVRELAGCDLGRDPLPLLREIEEGRPDWHSRADCGHG